MHDDDRIAAAYAWGLEESGRPRTDEVQREQFERLTAMSPAEMRAAMRGMRDAQPVSAPLPLAFHLAEHLIWVTLMSEAQRGGRWYHYLVVGPALFGFARLSMEAARRVGPARARAAGIERRADAPRVPTRLTPLWVGVMLPVMILRRILERPPRKQSPYETAATGLAVHLVTWWAWRPYLRRAARRA